ncbi:unnamed protein product, partial [Amoebophrya sp. A25]|eukprot:GSA25T00009142001.1
MVCILIHDDHQSSFLFLLALLHIRSHPDAQHTIFFYSHSCIFVQPYFPANVVAFGFNCGPEEKKPFRLGRYSETTDVTTIAMFCPVCSPQDK